MPTPVYGSMPVSEQLEAVRLGRAPTTAMNPAMFAAANIPMPPQNQAPHPAAAIGRRGPSAQSGMTIEQAAAADPEIAAYLGWMNKRFSGLGGRQPGTLSPARQPSEVMAAQSSPPQMPSLSGEQMNRAQVAGQVASGAPMSLGFTNYDEGREKMKQAAMDAMRGVTQRLLENADGTHFQGARPVTGADGRVHWIKDTGGGGVDPERLASAKAALDERMAAREGGEPAPSREATPLMRERFQAAKSRKAEQSARADRYRSANAQAVANAARQAQQAMLARQNPDYGRALVAAQAQREALQQQASMAGMEDRRARELAGMEDSRTRQLASQAAEQQNRQFTQSQTAAARQHAERLAEIRAENERRTQEMQQNSDPAMIAMAGAEQAVANDPTLNYEEELQRRYNALNRMRQFGQQGGGMAGPGGQQGSATPGPPRDLELGGGNSVSTSSVPQNIRDELAGMSPYEQRQLLIQQFGVTDPAKREEILRELNPDANITSDWRVNSQVPDLAMPHLGLGVVAGQLQAGELPRWPFMKRHQSLDPWYWLGLTGETATTGQQK